MLNSTEYATKTFTQPINTTHMNPHSTPVNCFFTLLKETSPSSSSVASQPEGAAESAAQEIQTIMLRAFPEVGPSALLVAEDAARRAGITIERWLDSAIVGQALNAAAGSTRRRDPENTIQ